jgi:ABC-type cobalamin/Fe3+-siderophores transport system ATPase subunit
MIEHELPLTPWPVFLASLRWRQAEHVTVIGPTGTGKTTLMRALMPIRYRAGAAVAVLATKTKDDNLARWAREDGLTITRKWPPRPPRWWQVPPDHVAADGRVVPWEHRVMVWPLPPKGSLLAEIAPAQADMLRRAAADMFWAGQWCVVAEELLYLCDDLGMAKDLRALWTQGRSAGVTLVGGVQRPRDIPLYAYSQASHLFMFAHTDDEDLDRLSGIGGMDSKRLAAQVRTLPEHHVLYVSTRERRALRTLAPYHLGRGGQ